MGSSAGWTARESRVLPGHSAALALRGKTGVTLCCDLPSYRRRNGLKWFVVKKTIPGVCVSVPSYFVLRVFCANRQVYRLVKKQS